MANKEKVLISDLYYSTEKNMPVVGGALYQGYKEMVSGNKERGRKIIVDFLTHVYPTRERSHENTTQQFVDKIRRNMGLPKNEKREYEILDIIREACEMRFDMIHNPLFESIMQGGYNDKIGETITIRKNNNQCLLVDGKNRVSILSAMGEQYLPNNWEYDL